MKLGTIFSSTATAEDDELAQKRAHRERVRVARLEYARRESGWTEIPAERLVARGPRRFGWMVDAETDKVWVRYPGSIFVTGSVTVIQTHSPVTFFVADGEVVPIERAQHLTTWSAVIRQRPELARA